MANYVFITGIDTETYDTFVRNHATKSHFLQSSTWGKIMEQGNYKPIYVALKEGKKIVAAALLLKRSLPMGYSYFYSPRGFVLDYDKKGLLEEFTKRVTGFVKQQKGIFLYLTYQKLYRKCWKNNLVCLFLHPTYRIAFYVILTI